MVDRLGPLVRRITLFGSYARGDFTADSDIDVFVLIQPFNRETKELIRDIAYQAMERYNFEPMLNTFVMGADDYAQRLRDEFSLQENVENEGLNLWPR